MGVGGHARVFLVMGASGPLFHMVAKSIVERYSRWDSMSRRGTLLMTVTETTVHIYEELAEGYARRHEARQRDLFLLLAADAALNLGQRDKAERLRQRLLFFNPHHLVKPFSSLADALQSSDFRRYVEDLRRQFPPDLAERLWQAQEQPFGEQRNEAANGLAPPAVESELKVYRLQEPAAKAVTPPIPPAAPSWLPSRQSPYAVAQTPSPRRKSTSEEATGAWLTMALFVLVLLGGLAGATYALIWPFVSR